jgi:hypothetical protein
VLGLAASANGAEIINSQRTALQDGIAHYTFDLDLGPDEFDVIRLHRVVRERRPFKPSATVTGLFLLPGAPNSFEMIFMAPAVSPEPAWDHSVAIFLAKNGIDVWGMDYAWAQIPLETTDFDFMEGWGLAREIHDTREALAAARSIRVATGQGNRKLHLLGFSYGVPIAYGLAGEETHLPPGLRHVKGIVSVDYDLKVDDESQRTAACEDAEFEQDQIDQGIYQSDSGVFFSMVGYLADTFPDDTSPFFNLLTNWEFALFAGTVHDPWHFVAGGFDPFPFPTGLFYTDADLWVDAAQAVPFYVPFQAFLDIDLTRCDEVDVPFDDYLSEIALPILAVGAAGGAAPAPYTPSLTASADIEPLTVQLLADGEAASDFGHADLFFAGNAEDLFWQPLLDWLLAHRENRTYPGP